MPSVGKSLTFSWLKASILLMAVSKAVIESRKAWSCSHSGLLKRSAEIFTAALDMAVSHANMHATHKAENTIKTQLTSWKQKYRFCKWLLKMSASTHFNLIPCKTLTLFWNCGRNFCGLNWSFKRFITLYEVGYSKVSLSGSAQLEWHSAAPIVKIWGGGGAACRAEYSPVQREFFAIFLHWQHQLPLICTRATLFRHRACISIWLHCQNKWAALRRHKLTTGAALNMGFTEIWNSHWSFHTPLGPIFNQSIITV